MISDVKGKLIYVNPAWVRVYGFSKDEAVGQTPRLLRSKYQDEAFYLDMWRQITDPKIGFWRGELINQAKNGNHVPVLLTITPYRNPDSSEREIMGYMGIAVDLTAQKELEVKVMQQDRLASVGLVASGLAHEIGTPLGVIRGRAELLSMLSEGNQAVQKGLEVIIAQIDRVSKLIKSFLRASRKPDDVVLVPTAIKPLVEDVLALFQQHARKYGVEIAIRLSESEKVLADANHLHQVFLNLFINSIHAIEKEIDRGRAANHRILISATRVGSKIEIDVEDTGCGMSPETLSRIFRPFFTTKEVGQGTGLGLAISSQIMTEMNGSVRAQSEGPGKGAKFTLSLPAASS